MHNIIIRLISASDTYSLRHRVLWPEKPPAYVQLAEDAAGRHYGAFRADELVAVISLFVDGEEARFRKFATHPEYQRQGIGSKLLTHVFKEAVGLGARSIWCDARADSAGFYQRFGMVAVGVPFSKGAIPYRRMQRALL